MSLWIIMATRLLSFVRIILLILNGRLDGSSKVTCKNVSTVDYFLCSTNVLPFVTNLYVHDFCDLLSDVLILDIFCVKNSFSVKLPDHEKVRLWNVEKSDVYLNNLEIHEIETLSRKFDELKLKEGMCQSYMDNFVMSLSNFHVETARKSFGIKLFILVGLGWSVFMPRHQKVAGYYVIPSEILSVRPSVRLSVCLSVRPSVRPSAPTTILVSATPPTVLGQFFWNFTGVLRMVWRYAYCFFRILKLFFITFSPFLT